MICECPYHKEKNNRVDRVYAMGRHKAQEDNQVVASMIYVKLKPIIALEHFDLRDFDVILGMDSLARHQVTIDYKKKTLSIPKVGTFSFPKT